MPLNLSSIEVGIYSGPNNFNNIAIIIYNTHLYIILTRANLIRTFYFYFWNQILSY